VVVGTSADIAVVATAGLACDVELAADVELVDDVVGPPHPDADADADAATTVAAATRPQPFRITDARISPPHLPRRHNSSRSWRDVHPSSGGEFVNSPLRP
jgi:hypothetical protein